MERLILASASPQRKTLLAGLGADFEVIPSSVNESDHPQKDPAKRAADLARLKALDVASKNQNAFVIGCDTLVVSADGELLEKPDSEQEARAMLQSHSGKKSIVHSALCIVSPDQKLYEGISSSTVTFKKLSEEDIAWWVNSNHWKDRSGGFQIDGPGQLMISHIEGDWTSIVGLPVFLLGELLQKAGFRIF
jgi:septum formation protein